jgi:predicted Zn-dependent protease
MILIGRDYENSLGLAAYREQLEGQKLVTSGADFERVQRVGKRVAAAASAAYPKETAGFGWEFTLVDTPDINAWMLPGGRSAVFTGILKLAATDDELAVVIGHEVAHALARHGAERISRGLVVAGLVVAATASEEVDPEIVAITAGAYGALGETAFSRGEESEADEIGLVLSASAGYDPRVAVGFWEKMAASSQGGPPEFLSTHPSGDTRARRLAKLMPRMVAIYDAARAKGEAR